MTASGAGTDDLFVLVYGELRRLAAAYLRRERRGMTLQPTALVHEAWMQLSSSRPDDAGHPLWNDRGHFIATAALAMRQVLAQYARRRKAAKRTPGPMAIPLAESGVISNGVTWDYDSLDQALERLEGEAPELCRVVEARYFGGLSVEETAAHLKVSTRTVKRHWMIARAWLSRELEVGPSE